jgi:hypothetical protein
MLNKTLVKNVANALDSYAVADKKISQVISDIGLQVYEQLSTTAKTNINQAIKVDDITKAKELTKTFVHAITGFDNKATVNAYKKSIAPKFYDDYKTEIFNGVEHSDIKVSAQFCYGMDKSILQGLKSEGGAYGKDGEALHAVMKRLNYRELMQNNVDTVFSRFTGAIVKAVLKQFGVVSVTGTVQPVPIALATKLNSVEAYFNTNFSKLTTMQVNEFKAWIKIKPNFLKS